MRRLVLIALALCAAIGCKKETVTGGAPARTAANPLEGSWTMTSSQYRGNEVPGTVEAGVVWTFGADGSLTAKVGTDAPHVEKYTRDDSKSPKQIHTVDSTGQVNHGVYEVKGHTLLVCFPIAPDDPSQPTELKAEGELNLECPSRGHAKDIRDSANTPKVGLGLADLLHTAFPFRPWLPLRPRIRALCRCLIPSQRFLIMHRMIRLLALHGIMRRLLHAVGVRSIRMPAGALRACAIRVLVRARIRLLRAAAWRFPVRVRTLVIL
jgi:uncharacterized protein (TIGR03067 family)